MENYLVELNSPVSTSFRCQKAAQSLDIDTTKKSKHRLEISCDIKSDFNIGLIIGASGSGKTTLAQKIYGEDFEVTELDETKPIIEQLPESMTYDECASILNGVGLTSVPCWIRPVYTLSNGQKARALAALVLTTKDNAVIDEWTSVVDRTVAKAMSNCLQKVARKKNKKIVLLSCHYDVFEWLNPDWIIDCNKQTYTDRRSLWQNYERKEKLVFEIRETTKETWKMFSKYHYLSEKLAGGKNIYYGLFLNDDQIGFQCFSNYVPWVDKSKPMQMHSNRTVIHPDYVGLGLGITIINKTSELMKAKGYDVRAKFSSVPVYKAFQKFPEWRLIDITRQFGKVKGGDKLGRMQIDSKGKKKGKSSGGFRTKIKTYSYRYMK